MGVDGERPLAGRVALVTGVSRRIGIAYELAARLASLGADVLVTSWEPHDAAQPWGADPLGTSGVIEALRGSLPPDSGRILHRAVDLALPAAPASLIDWAYDECGALDALVATHARSSEGYLEEVTATEIDLSYAVNVRATLLLIQAYAARHDDARPGGRVITFTSGQHHGPMPNELAYIASKGALQQLTTSLAAHLARRRITVNCIDPGPVDTGYADEESREFVAARMPQARWGTPVDVANLVEFLVSDAAAWITGQTLVSDGGWSLRSGIPPA
jgi:3-oxoacyl-[acyl-carrier protein] reductase